MSDTFSIKGLLEERERMRIGNRDAALYVESVLDDLIDITKAAHAWQESHCTCSAESDHPSVEHDGNCAIESTRWALDEALAKVQP